ncbi:MAG: hypothetical protein V1750_07885 [Acidobacteriota bacterium]
MNGALLVAAGLTGLLMAAGYLLCWPDRWGLEPLPNFLALAALGAASALLLAAYHVTGSVVDPLLPHLSALPPVVAEAAARLLTVAASGAEAPVLLVLVLLLPVAGRFRETLLDGLSFGLAAGCGLGLAALVIQSLSGGYLLVEWVGFSLLLRAASGATLGAGLRWAELADRWPGKLGRGMLTLLGTVFLFALAHTIRSFENEPWIGGLLVLVWLAGVGVAAAAWERRVLREQLGEEAALGVLPEELCELVADYRRRVRSDWWPRADERRVLVRLLTMLAFRKLRLRARAGEKATVRELEVGKLREQARRLLNPKGWHASVDRPALDRSVDSP